MLSRSAVEKRLERDIFRRSEHVGRNPAFRLAGKLFSEAADRAAFRNEKRQSMQKSRPVGIGFGTYDTYGPDESWASQESLIGIHDRGHYIVGENHGFSFDSPE